MELLISCFNIPSGVLRKKNPSSREYKDLALIAVFIGLSIEIKRFENKHSEVKIADAVPPIPSLYL